MKQTTTQIKSGYEQWHLQRAETEDSEATLNAPWNQFIRNFIGPIQGKKILEIACGRGQLSAYLAGQGAEVIAADFSMNALHVLKQEGRDRQLQVVNADATRLGFRNNSFDFVVSCETIEHVLAPWDALEEYRRILRPGGKLLLTFPSYLNSYGLYRLYLKATGRPYNSGVAIQPIENWLFSFHVAARLKRIGLHLTYQGGSGFYGLWPGRNPINLYSHDPKLPWNSMLRPFALHAYLIAQK